MSHMTADLEYFKCDMCGVYMHRDIFCDHRRDCHGRDSAVLKRGECAMLSEALGRETRELLWQREREAANAAACAAVSGWPQKSPAKSASVKEEAAADASATAGSAGSQCGEAGAVLGARGAASTGDGVSMGKSTREGTCVAGTSSHAVTQTADATASVSAASGVEAATAGHIRVAVSTAELERRQEARTRRAVSDRYQATLDAKISAMLTTEKKAALMDFLNS